MTKYSFLLSLILTLTPSLAESQYEGALFDTSCQAGLENSKYQGKKRSKIFSELWSAHSVEGATLFTAVEAGDDDDDDDDDGGRKPKKPGSAANYLKQLRGSLKAFDVVYFLNIGVPGSDGPKKNLKLKSYKAALQEVKLRFKVKKPVTKILHGIGEVQQMDWTADNFHADDPKMLSFISKFAVKNKFPFFMIHFPGGPNSTNFNKLAEIETTHFANLLATYPDITFLVHLFLPDFVELAQSGGLTTLIETYPNWIFSVDVGNILGRFDNNGGFMCPLMFCCDRDGTCESNDLDPAPEALNAFISEYDETRDSAVQSALNIYKQYIEGYPDRFAWGTENGKIWHLNSEAYSRIIDFSRRFIDGLDPSVQDAFARQNARRVFLGENL